MSETSRGRPFAPRIARLTAALSLLLAAHDAEAFTTIGTCNGSPVHLDTSSLAEFRMTCSFPDNSYQSAQFDRVVANWNVNSHIPVTGFDRDTDCTFSLGNWHNEVGLVDRSAIQGRNGLTFYAHENFCFSDLSAGNYSESDSQLASDLDIWSQHQPGEIFSNCGTAGSCTDPRAGYAFAVMVHEMGHQLGLGDSSSHVNMMWYGPDWFPGGINGPTPYPEDARGVSSLYGSDGSRNLFPSAQHLASTASGGVVMVQNIPPGSETVCANGTLSAAVTLANMGPAVTYSHDVWLTRNPDGSSPAVSFTWTNSFTTEWRTSHFFFDLSLEGLGIGTYYLVHRVDSGNQVSERNENDNLLVYPTPIVIIDCTGALTWQASAASGQLLP